MTSILILVAVAFAGWAISLYAYPFRRCRRCAGSGRKTASTRRVGPCPHCAGTGRVQRPGSRLAYRTALSIRSRLAAERESRREGR